MHLRAICVSKLAKCPLTCLGDLAVVQNRTEHTPLDARTYKNTLANLITSPMHVEKHKREGWRWWCFHYHYHASAACALGDNRKPYVAAAPPCVCLRCLCLLPKCEMRASSKPWPCWLVLLAVELLPPIRHAGRACV
jgi:hypothetical protein